MAPDRRETGVADLPQSHRVWAWQGTGGPLDLRLETRPLPTPAPGEVLVRNHAIGLNPVDWKVLGSLPSWVPGHVPGVDGAGVVVALGGGVDPAWLGRRVAYHQSLHAHGSFADHVPVRAAVLLRLPAALGWTAAAAFPCPALTAHLALEKLPHHPGARLLASGAGGAVGRWLVQMAAARGWQVTAMCHPRHWDRLRRQGAVACHPGPLAQGALWDGPRFTAVVDSVGPDHAARLAPALRANGHLLCIQGRVAQWPTPAFGLAPSLHEVALGALHLHGDAADWARLVQAGEGMLAALATGGLTGEPVVEDRFEALAQRLEALRNRDFSGKPVLLV
jgi:NADPH:quinone reductase